LVKVIKPRTLGILLRTQRRSKTTALYTVSALGLFDAEHPGIFLSEQALWPAVMAELPEGAVFDQGLPKPQGEFLVAGYARAPSGSAVRAQMIEVAIGSIGKRVAVFGDRYWRPGASGFIFTEPQPFTEMKIDLKRMYGGADHPQNTVGTGYRATRLLDAGQIVHLPNFEDPRRLIRTIEETPPPVGLGPIDIAAPDLRKYTGTFDKAWEETLAPHPPLDSDPRINCAAPEDQRIAGFFEGNEPLRVNGMTADVPGYVGRLPGVRARAFVMRRSEPAGFFELDMKLDTVLLLGGHRKGVVIFRGSIPVADVDAKDVASVMIAYERLTETPRPIEHYAEVYRLRTDKEQAIKYALDDSQLSPAVSADEKAARRRAREAYTRETAERFAEGAQLVARRQMALAGLPESLVPAKPDPVQFPILLPSPEEIESGDIDLAEIIDGMEKLGQEAQQRLEAIRDAAEAARGDDGSLNFNKLMSDLEGLAGIETSGIQKGLAETKSEVPTLDDLLKDLGDAPAESKDRAVQAHKVVADLLTEGTLRAPTPLVDEDAFVEACKRFLETPDAGIFGTIRSSVAGARKTLDSLPPQDPPKAPETVAPFGELLQSLANEPAQPATGQASPPKSTNVSAQLTELDTSLRKIFPALATRPEQSLEALVNDLATMAPTASVKSPEDAKLVLDDAGTKIEEAAGQVKDGLAQLRRLAPEPLYPEPALSPSAALRFGMFVYEQWRSGADLRGRDLAGADLSGMDLQGIDLTGAFLERANLSRTNLRGAQCEQTVFAAAKLDAACFDDAKLAKANMARVSATAATFKRANLESINAFEARFAGADFESARFAETQMVKVDLRRARLAGVIAKQLVFVQCELDELQANGAVLERCQIIDCRAPDVAFRNAAMERCSVLKFNAPRADFAGSTLDGTGFASGAELQSACFDGASLRGVTLQGANLERASFVRARLDGAVVSDAHVTDANFSCASLKRAQFVMANLSRCEFFAANFFEAQMRRANLAGARLRSANLYCANFADSDLTGADLTGANRAKSHFALETSHGH
jgi:uncharacterized protein YjbI with pentapeptide repeats